MDEGVEAGPTPSAVDFPQRQLDGELSAVAVNRSAFEAPVEHAVFPAGKEPGQPGAELGDEDRLGQEPTDRLL